MAQRARMMGCGLVLSGAILFAAGIGACAKNGSGQIASDRAPAQLMKEVPPVEWQLELTGSGLGRPTVFTYQQLAEMEVTRLEHIVERRTHAPDSTRSWRGPELDTLLAKVGIKPGPMTFNLEAADGYRIDCTQDELKSAILALQDGEGRWLTEVGKRFPLVLVSPEVPGNYWVRNIRRITVEPAKASVPTP